MRAVLFDLDGVLVDSEPAHVAAYTRLFREHGVVFDREAYRRHARGRPREAVLRHFLGERPAAGHESLMRAKVRYVEDFVRSEGLRPVPGSLAFVDALDRAGIPYIVATSSRTPGLLLGAAGIAHRFPRVVSRSDVSRGKPHPDLFEEAARRLAQVPSDCWVIEDAEAGVEAGLAAGCTVVALAPDGDFTGLGGAQRRVRSLESLLPL